MLEKFITENLLSTENFISVSTKEVYERYLIFCSNRQIKPFEKKEFYSKLEHLGILRNRNRKNFKGWFLKRCPY